MKRLFDLVLLVCCWGFVSSCQSDVQARIGGVEVLRTALQLHPNEGKWYHRNQAFTGYAVSYSSDSVLREKIGFYEGKKEGIGRWWHTNGALQKEVFYIQNKVDKQIRGWSPQGVLVLESNYVDRKKHGVETRWYPSGQMYKRQTFNHGKEEGMQQAWTREGDLFINCEMKNGRTFGMKKAEPCYTLKDEEIKY